MKPTGLSIRTLIAAGAVGTLALAVGIVYAQAPGGSGRGGGGRGGRGAGTPLAEAVDTNNNDAVTRDEMKKAFDAWYAAADRKKSNAITQFELQVALTPVFNRAKPEDISAMDAALPATPGAKPLKARKILVFGNAAGFIHSSIPLAAKTVADLGEKGNLWTTTVTYDPADINAANLKQYDLIFLDSTTGCFLDDPKDPAATAARRKAFMDFVNDGKGIAGIHAASDSYHTDCSKVGGMGGSANPVTVSTLILKDGDTNGDQKLSRQEMDALANTWFDKIDTAKTGTVSRADFAERFNAEVNPSTGGGFGGGFGRGFSGRGGGRGRGAAETGEKRVPLGQMPPGTVLDWPEFNKLIGGYFKFHWTYPQLITVKIDDPNSPLTAMFHGKEFEIHDETYTFAQDSYTRKNLHILTSIDYDKMSEADKDKEPAATGRTDGDYALSYIHRQGKGRVFYEAHGHDEKIYAMTPMLEHVRAGIQYALGDLKADDSPSQK
ncbi:MAG TPA: ThuA domain-containing protein [Bryobacteraceae bacterium]|nr:ThuA domain-containing protein [Bryobacteraceae bacterium]